MKKSTKIIGAIIGTLTAAAAATAGAFLYKKNREDSFIQVKPACKEENKEMQEETTDTTVIEPNEKAVEEVAETVEAVEAVE